MNDYRPVENAYGDRYYDKDARVPYNINNNAYPSAHKHDWDRKNAVIVNSSPPQRTLPIVLAILTIYSHYLHLKQNH